jgi:hypothetical protein
MNLIHRWGATMDKLGLYQTGWGHTDCHSATGGDATSAATKAPRLRMTVYIYLVHICCSLGALGLVAAKAGGRAGAGAKGRPRQCRGMRATAAVPGEVPGEKGDRASAEGRGQPRLGRGDEGDCALGGGRRRPRWGRWKRATAPEAGGRGLLCWRRGKRATAPEAGQG